MNVRASWEVVPADEQPTPVGPVGEVGLGGDAGLGAEIEDPRKRPKTMSRREMLRERRRRERAGEVVEVLDYDRPRTRAECKTGPRPCLFVSCKHHLYLDVNPETGSVKLNFP